MSRAKEMNLNEFSEVKLFCNKLVTQCVLCHTPALMSTSIHSIPHTSGHVFIFLMLFSFDVFVDEPSRLNAIRREKERIMCESLSDQKIISF